MSLLYKTLTPMAFVAGWRREDVQPSSAPRHTLLMPVVHPHLNPKESSSTFLTDPVMLEATWRMTLSQQGDSQSMIKPLVCLVPEVRTSMLNVSPQLW